MRNSTPATMKEVADRAGVSTMTVSLALRSGAPSSRITEETRQRVLEAARALRYRPNARARALRSGSTNIIGLYAGYGFVNVRQPFFTEIVSGLQEGCEEFRKDLLLHGIFHGETPDDILTELVDGRIDGLVVNIPAAGGLARKLAESQLPVVAVADSLPDIPSIFVDDATGSRLLVEHLHTQGYTGYIYLSCYLPAVSAVRRRESFVAAARECGMAEVATFPCDSESWDRELLPNLLALVRSHRRLAIVCWNDHTAYGILAELQRQGLRVPEDAGLVGFDGCPTPYEGVWSLTTVRAPWAAVARTAVEQINELLKGHTVPSETSLPVKLIRGQTT